MNNNDADQPAHLLFLPSTLFFVASPGSIPEIFTAEEIRCVFDDI